MLSQELQIVEGRLQIGDEPQRHGGKEEGRRKKEEVGRDSDF